MSTYGTPGRRMDLPPPRRSRRAIERDGLVAIADIGYLDEDGFLYLCDRRNDMIISGGVNVGPPRWRPSWSPIPASTTAPCSNPR